MGGGFSANWTFSAALPQARGLWSARLLTIMRSQRPCSEWSQMETGWPGEAGCEQGATRGGAGTCRRRERRRRASSDLPRPQPQLLPLIASPGPPRTGRLKSAHCSVRGQQHTAPGGQPTTAPAAPAAGSGGPSRPAGASLGLRSRRTSWRGRPAQGRVLRPAAALSWTLGAMAQPLPPSHPPGLAGRGLANPQRRERSQALCFSRSAQGQGNPACLLVGMDYWKIRRKVPCTSACTVLFGRQQAMK